MARNMTARSKKKARQKTLKADLDAILRGSIAYASVIELVRAYGGIVSVTNGATTVRSARGPPRSYPAARRLR